MGETKKVTMLTVEDILGALDCEPKVIEMPEWQKDGKSGSVTVKPLDHETQLKLRREYLERKDEEGSNESFEVMMFIHGVIEPKFSVEHVEALQKKNAQAIGRVFQEIIGVVQDEEDEAEASKQFRS